MTAKETDWAPQWLSAQQAIADMQLRQTALLPAQCMSESLPMHLPL